MTGSHRIGRPSSQSLLPHGSHGAPTHTVSASPVAVRLGIRDSSAISLSPSRPDAEVPWDQLDAAGPVMMTEKYEVLGEIGRGSMGVILRGYDRDVRREIAIKLMADEHPTAGALARFLEEGQITGQLEHPNVAPVHEIGLDDRGRLYFTMKVVRGRSLHERIDRLVNDMLELRGDRSFPLRKRLEVFKKICDAISFAHSRGVIHRDLKPENVMVGEFGEVQVMDWGLAKILGRSERPFVQEDELVTSDRVEEAVIRTKAGAIAGTPAYMPPEQAWGKVDEVDERSDIYSLGGILYELLVFSPPFDGDSILEVLEAVKQGRMEAPSERLKKHPELVAAGVKVPPELEAIVLRATEPDARRRYRSVSDLRDDVDAWLGDEPVTAYRDSWYEGVVKWGRRHPTRAIGWGAAALLLVMTSAVFAVGYALVTQAELAASMEEEARAKADAKARRAEVDAARKEQHLAEERAARMQLEQERLEAERVAAIEAEARIRAEQEAREEELRRLAAEGQLEQLQRMLGSQINRQRHQAFAEFRRAFEDAVAAGKSNEEFIEALGEQRIQATIEVMLRALDAAEQMHTVTIDAQDLFHLGILFDLGTREYGTAEYYYTQAISHDARGEYYLHRARVREKQGRINDAIADFDEATRLDATRPLVFVSRAEFWRRQGQLTRAVQDYDRAVVLDPDDPLTRSRRAWLHMDMTNFSAALDDFDAILRVEPDHIAALAGRAAVRRLMGDLDAALADVERALQLDQTNIRARLTLGQVWLDRGRIDKALEEFETVLRQHPGQPDALYLRARLRHQQANPLGAIDDYNEILAVNPDHVPALIGRGEAWLDIDAEKALADLRRATQLAPAQWRPWSLLGQAYIVFNLRPEAAEALEKAWRRCPDARVRQQLSQTIWQLVGRAPRDSD